MNNNQQSKADKLVGQTASAGYQIGVRRIFPISPEEAWAFLISSEGLGLWLGNINGLAINEGETFTTSEGNSGEFRVVKPFQQLCLKWRKNEWAKPSTLQIRLISDNPDRTTISFHQENLDNANTREQMKLHWENVLTTIKHQTSHSDNPPVIPD
ncbi:ATPase [Paenibacillus pectinilyticus]|uniref:ATPase n=1 Tax=Paenibacillus pectinilyticus TaxID=512399 RepID=A0A1C0ZUW6_9BACL|nr:SRPBCC domain-containing protein [Paenibacillus pectinilyticus]OCT11895.1 ATPase [Paenibacillus pectinilyticus]